MAEASIKQARSLRRTAPTQERRLWQILRGRQLDGLKFRRQVPLGPYVVDFLCLHYRLIVEADGPFHDPERDAQRDAWLTHQGFKVLRLSNSEIGTADHLVIRKILDAVGRPDPLGEA
jgi:very-short-patch-repair endonuclease